MSVPGCANCVYFVEKTREDPPDARPWGRCRRYPPTLTVFQNHSSEDTRWPALFKTDWCGEWSAEVPT